MKPLNRQGFTLLELIISLTIFSLVAVIVYATLNLGVGAADRGEGRSAENQRARAALSLITRQLKSAYPLTLQAEGETFVYFFGKPQELSFIATTGQPETGGLEKVTYYVKKNDGRQSLWVRTSAPALPADLVEDREGSLMLETEVLPDVEELAWSYFGRVGTEEEWAEDWNGRDNRQLPKAIRLSWQAKLGVLPEEWQIEVPLNVLTIPASLRASPQSDSPFRSRAE